MSLAPTRLNIMVTEGDLNPAFISAFAALAGAIIGGLTSFATSWFTQRAQLQSADRQARRAKLEALYNEHLTQVASLYVDALTHNTEDHLENGASLRVGQPVCDLRRRGR